MGIRGILEVVGFNALLLFLLYLVIGDEAQRTAYAAGKGFSFTFSRFFLVQTTTLQGPRGTLQSALSVDWVQVLLVALIFVDVLHAYGWVERRRRPRLGEPVTGTS